MMNIFGIFFLSFFSFRKTIITIKFATIPTDAMVADKIIITPTVCKDPLIEFRVGISVIFEILTKGFGIVEIRMAIVEVDTC